LRWVIASSLLRRIGMFIGSGTCLQLRPVLGRRP
jgi:hypothetical protein